MYRLFSYFFNSYPSKVSPGAMAVGAHYVTFGYLKIKRLTRQSVCTEPTYIIEFYFALSVIELHHIVRVLNPQSMQGVLPFSSWM